VKKGVGLVIFCLALLMVSALSGCGGKEALRVGTEASFPPFETVGDDNKIIGFDIDIINFIAEDNGWDIVVINRSFDTLVDALARYYAIDLVALRQRCSKLLHGRNFMPLPLHPNLTLVPLALGKCGEKTGYINLLAVKDVRPQGKYSLVELDNCSLDCELSVAGVRNRLLRAQFVLRELERRGLIAPIGDKDWQHKLELIKAVLSK